MADLTPPTRTRLMRDGRRMLRAALFVAIAGFIVAGPFYRQVLDGSNPVFRQWQMYRNNGRDVIVLAFERERAGTWHAIDYLPALRAALATDARRLRISDPAAVRRVANALCTHHPGTRLRYRARQASLADGWRTLAEHVVVHCRS